MDAVAYINPAVISFVNENLVPLRLQASDPVLGTKYKVKWTPALLLLDEEGIEQYRTLGFYPPDELIPSLLLGMGKAKFNLPNRPAACEYFNKVVAQYPKSSSAPEAIYLNGVSKYIESHEAANLIQIYDQLKEQYPQSPWLTRAEPYSLLKK
jgi:tetratricopeptide (TPR) repeat protein